MELAASPRDGSPLDADSIGHSIHRTIFEACVELPRRCCRLCCSIGGRVGEIKRVRTRDAGNRLSASITELCSLPDVSFYEFVIFSLTPSSMNTMSLITLRPGARKTPSWLILHYKIPLTCSTAYLIHFLAAANFSSAMALLSSLIVSMTFIVILFLSTKLSLVGVP